MSDLPRLLNDVMLSGVFRQLTLTVREDGTCFASLCRRDFVSWQCTQVDQTLNPADHLVAFFEDQVKRRDPEIKPANNEFEELF